MFGKRKKGSHKNGDSPRKRGGSPRRQQHRPSHKQSKRKKPRTGHLDGQDKPFVRKKHPTREVEDLYEETSQVIERFSEDVESIAEKVAKLTSDELQEYKTKLYDDFSLTMDDHFEVTNHYGAGRVVTDPLARYLRFPIIDPSAGTGALFEYVLFKFIQSYFIQRDIQRLSRKRRRNVQTNLELGAKKQTSRSLPDTKLPKDLRSTPLIVLNDLSEGMHERMRERFATMASRYPDAEDMSENEIIALQGLIDRIVEETITFEKLPIEELAESYNSRYQRSFASIFISQTLHVAISKIEVMHGLFNILRPGGTLVSLEEFPFFVTESPYIKMVREALRITTKKMRDKFWYTDRMKEIGFVYDKIKDEKQERIDDIHKMYGFRFRRKGRILMPEEPTYWEP